MDIIFMGTACASSGVERDNTYLLFQQSESCTLIDVGGNPLGKLKELAIPTSHIKRLLFTHFHIDHIYGFPSLLWGMWIDGRTEPFDIYCTEENQQWLEDWLTLLQVKMWPIAFEIRIIPFDWRNPSLIWQDEEFSLSVLPSIHGSVPTVGVEVVYRDKVIVYSADTILNPLINQYTKIDLLIHEATTARHALPTHSSLQGIVEYYNLAVIQKVIPVHLMDHEPYEEVLNELPMRVRSKITMVNDLATINIE